MSFTKEDMVIFEREMNNIGVEFVKMQDVNGGYGISIQVDLDTGVDYSNLVEQQLVMKKLTKRQDVLYIFLKNYDKENGRLTLTVGAPISEDIFRMIAISGVQIGTTFPDFCWYHAEGTTPETALEVETKLREDCKPGDLTWVLPSRFADNIIEIMHTLNQTFLQGLMQDTIIYGPYFMTDN